MERFYRRLAHGRPAAAALQEARVDLLRRPPGGTPSARWSSLWHRNGAPAPPPDASHPFHWAAFELMGAPR
jgi:CHAT domain-containing protein